MLLRLLCQAMVLPKQFLSRANVAGLKEQLISRFQHFLYPLRCFMTPHGGHGIAPTLEHYP